MWVVLNGLCARPEKNGTNPGKMVSQGQLWATGVFCVVHTEFYKFEPVFFNVGFSASASGPLVSLTAVLSHPAAPGPGGMAGVAGMAVCCRGSQWQRRGGDSGASSLLPFHS